MKGAGEGSWGGRRSGPLEAGRPWFQFGCLSSLFLKLLKLLNLSESPFPYLQNGASDDLIRLLEVRVYVKQVSHSAWCLVDAQLMVSLSLFPYLFHRFLFPPSLAPPPLSPWHQVCTAFRVKAQIP